MANLVERTPATTQTGRLILAPMHGLADDVLRAVLTGLSPYDYCVTEFIRVTESALPGRTFLRVAPELKHASRTLAGTPVRVQLLGSDPQRLAASAAQLVELNPAGIDLNFGCPAPTVNRHRGGAILLNEPDLLYAIVAAMRPHIPHHIPFTAKMRLGVEDTHNALRCASALAAGGADELIVHARTKADGYRPPARWEWIQRICDTVTIPVIANGEIWNEADYHACRAMTGCDDIMIGRGAIADPLLVARLRGQTFTAEKAWVVLQGAIADFWQRVQVKVTPHHCPGRLKLWLNYLRLAYPAAESLYQHIRAAKTIADCDRVLQPFLQTPRPPLPPHVTPSA